MLDDVKIREYKISENQKILSIMINSYTLIFLMISLLHFMKLNYKMGVMSLLVANVINQAGSFVIFYILWIIVMTLLFHYTGVNWLSGEQGEDFKEVNKPFAAFI